jgi:5-methylcytosine-specific restriction endonuclease McrA
MHHIVPRSRLRLDTVDNCATICFVCHRLVEDKKLKLDFKKLLKERRKQNTKKT